MCAEKTGAFLNVTSEIGKLKAVLLHKPGRELERLTPDHLESSCSMTFLGLKR